MKTKAYPPATASAAIPPTGLTRRGRLRWLASGVRSYPIARSRSVTVLHTVGTSLAVFCMAAVQGILLARILGPHARGEYATVVFYTQTLTYIGMLGTMYSIARRAAGAPESRRGLERASFRLGWLTGLGTMAVVVVLSLTALPAQKQYLAPLGIACAAMLPWEHSRLALLSVDHGSASFTRYNANRLFSAAVFPALLLIVWTTQAGSLTALVLLTILVPMLGLAVRLVSARDGSLSHPGAPPPGTLIREGGQYAFAMVATDVFNRLDVFLILWLASITAQGYYAAAVPAACLLAVAPNALALFAFNAGARHDHALTRGKLLAAGGAVAGLQLFTALGYAALLKPLMILVFGDAFRGAVPFALALLPAYAISGCSQVAEGYLRGRGRALVGVWSRLMGTPVIAIVVYLLFHRWQELSIPLAVAAGQFVSTAWVVWAVVQDVRRRQPAANPLPA